MVLAGAFAAKVLLVAGVLVAGVAAEVALAAAMLRAVVPAPKALLAAGELAAGAGHRGSCQDTEMPGYRYCLCSSRAFFDVDTKFQFNAKMTTSRPSPQAWLHQTQDYRAAVIWYGLSQLS